MGLGSRIQRLCRARHAVGGAAETRSLSSWATVLFTRLCVSNALQRQHVVVGHDTDDAALVVHHRQARHFAADQHLQGCAEHRLQR